MGAKLPELVFYYRGQIEVPAKAPRFYRWTDGYSMAGAGGAVCYPWATKTECRNIAHAAGKRAVFVRGADRGR